MRACVLICFVIALPLRAATYYVATNGSNGNGGTDPDSDAWLTIAHAGSNIIAGDTVIVGPGEYNEYVTNFSNSGTPANPIMYRGTRSGSSWLTIVNPSSWASNNWSYAPEVGAGVYKRAMSGNTDELTITNKRSAYVREMGDMSAALTNAYVTPGITDGREVLGLATNQQFTIKGGGVVYFWDGVEAIWGKSNATTYLRFRHSNDPNGLLIRAASATHSAIRITGSNIVWRDFHIRGASASLLLTGTSCRDNIIESNYLENGRARVLVENGAHRNRVSRNVMTCNYYGSDNPGAWASSPYTNIVRHHLYMVSKYLMGPSATDDAQVDLNSAGASNIIAWNTMTNGLGTGVELGGALGSPVSGTIVCSNTVRGLPSAGIHLSIGQTQTRVFENDVIDCNLNMRWHRFNESGETNRTNYIYRNRMLLPSDAGSHVYVHYNDSSVSYSPEIWFYHNSVDGGAIALSISTYAGDYGGMTNVHCLNNIMSGVPYSGGGWSLNTNSWIVGDFDYNLLTPPYPTYPVNWPIYGWVKENCISNNFTIWTNQIPAGFGLGDNSPAIDVGMDLPTTYPSLPQTTQSKGGSTWDMGAYEFVTQFRRHQFDGLMRASGKVVLP